MEYLELIKKRKTTRSFKNDRIERENILDILRAGNLAPTAKNNQPQRIIVVENEIKKIDNVTPCRYNAPLCLIICGNKDEAFNIEGESTLEMDCSIVATHMILEATNLNVDSVWVRNFNKKKLKEEFNLEDNIEPICLIMLGYRTDDCIESPNHDIRKNIDDYVKFL